MRKLSIILLALALSINLVACGGDPTMGSLPDSGTKVEQHIDPTMGSTIPDDFSKSEGNVETLPSFSDQDNGTTVTLPAIVDATKAIDVVVIDCGQADSIIIDAGSQVALIDAGEEKDAAEIIEALDARGITTIDLLVATHAHSDHIGGMQTIVEKYDIKNILMSPTGHTSKTYENLLLAIQGKGLMVDKANPGDVYSIGEMKLEVIAPVEYYDDLNNSSVVIIGTYGDVDFLFTGDAEQEAEADFIGNVRDVEILKSGHHGSDTSSSDLLINTATPEIALISCGEGNKYGHPKQSTLDKYENAGMTTYRTDIHGTITVTTDGVTYEISTYSGEYSGVFDGINNDGATNPNVETTTIVYITDNGTKFHQHESCVSLKKSTSVSSVPIETAMAQGKDKCSKCW